MMELEAKVWCPSCKVDKFEIYRKKLREGVYEHVTEPVNTHAKTCNTCGKNLERHV